MAASPSRRIRSSSSSRASLVHYRLDGVSTYDDASGRGLGQHGSITWSHLIRAPWVEVVCCIRTCSRSQLFPCLAKETLPSAEGTSPTFLPHPLIRVHLTFYRRVIPITAYRTERNRCSTTHTKCGRWISRFSVVHRVRSATYEDVNHRRVLPHPLFWFDMKSTSIRRHEVTTS